MPKPKRLAVIDRDLCNPKTCGFYLCQKVCPRNRAEEDCITVGEDGKPFIDEGLCIGCGICTKKCPRDAISIVNLPEKLDEGPIHRYGRNMFSLFRLPVPKRNAVVGLVGPNGVGKSTVMKILSGQLKPNAGLGEVPWSEIIERFKGSELQEYMEKLSQSRIKSAYKPQHIDLIPKKWKGKVSELLKKSDGRKILDRVVGDFGIDEMLDKDISELSGGELQLLAICATVLKDSDFYFFDEPSSYLDVSQRLRMAREIRRLSQEKVVMVIEHDLAVADYLADYTHILYGKPGVFGIVSKPYGVRIGINTYLEGYIKEDNVRFRNEPITFSQRARSFEKSKPFLDFPGFSKDFGSFSVTTEPGKLHRGEVIGILGPNSIGKTTFIKMLVGELKPDKGEAIKDMKLSYKPQRLILKKEQEPVLVADFLKEGVNITSTENKRILSFLGVDRLLERTINSLSGGELQSVFILSTLLKEHDILLMDEPSAFLDVEQRLRVSRLLRSHSESREIPVFVVDHDLQFIDTISDRIMLFQGEMGVKGLGRSPMGLEEGMNTFLKGLKITFRRDPGTGRPRANKPGSQKDLEQKEKGQYYYMG